MSQSHWYAVASGAGWMVLFRLFDRAAGVVSTLILSRLLLPADFGLVALGTAFWGLVELLGAFNFDYLLIQKQELNRRHFDTVWTLNFLFGVAFCGLQIGFAPWVADFFHEPRLQWIIFWLGITTLIGNLENIQMVMLRKELSFRTEFFYLAIKRVITFSVTIGSAWYLEDYRALVFGILSGRVAGTLLSYVLKPFNPMFSLAGHREILHFSRWFLLNNSINFAMQRFPDFILGKIMGSHAVGIYSLGFEIAQLPTTELLAPINRAVYPGLARLGDNVTALRTAFLRATGLMLLLTSPAALGIAALADSLVTGLMGSKWSEAGGLIPMLAVSGLLSAPVALISSVYIVLGKPRFTTLLNATYIILLIPSIAIAAHYDLKTVAIAHFLCSLAVLPLHYWIAVKALGFRWIELLWGLWRPWFASIAMFFVVSTLAGEWLARGYSDVECLLAGIPLGATLYGGIVWMMWKAAGSPDGAEQTFLSYLRRHWA